VYDQWWTKAQGLTGPDGVFRTRGFLGDYDVTISRNGSAETFPLTAATYEEPAYTRIGKQNPGSFNASAVLNAASFRSGPVAPGEIVTIYGRDIGSPERSQARYIGGHLQRHTGQTRVFFDGQPAPMIYSSIGQISAIVPYSVSAATSIEVEYLGTKTPAVTVPVATAAPGVFCYAAGRGQAVAVNHGAGLNGEDNPVERGGILTFYITGEGAVTPAIPDGSIPPAPDFPAPVEGIEVYLSGQPCEVLFAGLVFGGVTQVNARIPSTALTGPTIPLQVVINDVVSPDDVFVAVK
jgi:uncharacterized protein (TIGR03437 family)